MTTDERRLHVLLVAYACEPERGSEPGLGWQWVQALRNRVDLTVITRANQQLAIETHVGTSSSVRWIFYDLPTAVTRLKRGRSGIRWYYWLWMRRVSSLVASLTASGEFDVAHHVTLMSPHVSAVRSSQVPYVVGPIGGLQSLPLRLWVESDNSLSELVRSVRNYLLPRMPRWRRYVRNSAAFMVANEATRQAMPSGLRTKSTVRQIAVRRPESRTHRGEGRSDGGKVRFLWSGLDLRWKGLRLLLEAVGALPPSVQQTFRLDIAGVQRIKYWKAMVTKLGIEESVHIAGRLRRQDYLELLRQCDSYIFTSLRETTGAALLEAMAMGKACVAIGLGGPAEIAQEAGIVVPSGSRQELVRDIGYAIERLVSNATLREQLGDSARKKWHTMYSWDSLVQAAVESYVEAVNK